MEGPRVPRWSNLRANPRSPVQDWVCTPGQLQGQDVDGAAMTDLKAWRGLQAQICSLEGMGVRN